MERAGVGSLLLLCSILIFISLDCAYTNDEGDALYDFKSKLNRSDSLSSWNPTLVNPCTWFFVTCNAANSVTEVVLGKAELYGELHLDLSKLPNLQTLVLYSNTLSGDITSLTLPTSLETLDLHSNALSGDLNNLILSQNLNLKYIDLSDNVLEGTIPSGITNIPSLVNLDLSFNNLNGILPEWIGTHTSMMTINISYNSLSGFVPKSWDTVIQNTGLVDLTNNHDASSYTNTHYLNGSCTAQPCRN